MHASRWLDLSRAVFVVVGAGALIMSIGGLTSGESLLDPVFPAGLGLGALSLGAAASVTAPERWRAIVTWLGIGAVLAGVAVLGWLIFADRNIGPDVYPFFLVPAGLLVAAAAGMTAGRRSAGALGSASFGDVAAR